MAMQDKHLLYDCLETLKHLAMSYQAAAFECDNDELRKALSNIQTDKNELRNAVFNLMHQAGEHKTQAVDASTVEAKCRAWRQALTKMQSDMDAAIAKEDPGAEHFRDQRL